VVGGTAVLAATAVEAKRRRVLPSEEDVFREINDLPDELHGPVWAVMQAGSFAAVGVVSGVALAARRPRTALALGAAGTAAWGGAKLVKRRTQRGRPDAHVTDVKVRGRPQSGLGFPSGHSAVAVALASVATPMLPRPVRWAPWLVVSVTAAARMYVGAHLPLDVVGGLGLGAALGGATNLVVGGPAPGPAPGP
jgi:undecaprenyl-diphosphatase